MMAKMAAERHGAPVTMREVVKRMGGDETDEIRRVGEKLGFVDEAEYSIANCMGNVNEFRDAIIAMLKSRK